MMMIYIRRGFGQSFFKVVFVDRINGLIELKDLDLEINLFKVYECMIEQIEEDMGSFLVLFLKGIMVEQVVENFQV